MVPQARDCTEEVRAIREQGASAFEGVGVNGGAWPLHHDWRMTMTTIYTTAQSAPATAFGGFTRMLGNWADGLATFWVRREAMKALRAMNDRELRDIGLTRSHIEEAVWGKFDPQFGRTR
jgi:uncharacterized protein YjiS (DUF1127 family)